MERKVSLPMGPTFMVSAPGRVIVFGEHAAAFGKPAIAAAISLRSYLLVTTHSKSRRTATLNFRDIGLDHTWAIDTLPWSIFHHPSKKKFYYSAVGTLDPELLDAIMPHAEAVSKGLPEKQRKIHVRSAAAFLYLFLSLGFPQSPGFVYTLRSTIPIGAGLGSSASVCVCLSTALLLQSRTLAGPHPDQPLQEAELQIERINQWAYVGELCIHGDPSGVDNTVSSSGKAVLFQKNSSGPSSVTPIKFPKLRLILIDTQQSCSTATQVEKVQKLKDTHPGATGLVDAIGQVTTSALELLSSTSFDGADAYKALKRLGILILTNHQLLNALGVSHPSLERVRHLVYHFGIGWTKLTGAGGGGCAITLVRPGVNEKAVGRFEQQLTAEGFQKYDAFLGAEGVGVLWPAVFRNSSVGEPGEEIDQDMFENAVGACGIERLVGVGGREDGEGWKFWA